MKTKKKPRKRPAAAKPKKPTSYQKALEVERDALKSSKTHWDQR